MYYAATRPAEVIHLRIEPCHLPRTGWGILNLSGGVVTSGKEWTDDGEVREAHSLKRRAATATRPMPVPQQFVRMLRAHQERSGVDPAECARRAGQSIEVVFRHYDWGLIRGFWSVTGPEALVGNGIAVRGTGSWRASRTSP